MNASPPCIHTLWTFCFCLFFALHGISNRLLHRAHLHFVNICFPMRSYERDNVWVPLQSAEPLSNSAEAPPPPPHCTERSLPFIYNVLILNMLRVQIPPNPTLHFRCSLASTCQVWNRSDEQFSRYESNIQTSRASLPYSQIIMTNCAFSSSGKAYKTWAMLVVPTVSMATSYFLFIIT